MQFPPATYYLLITRFITFYQILLFFFFAEGHLFHFIFRKHFGLIIKVRIVRVLIERAAQLADRVTERILAAFPDSPDVGEQVLSSDQLAGRVRKI